MVDNDPSLEVEKWVDAWAEMWNAYDLSRVEDLFVTDERLSYFSSEKEGVITGIEAVREHHRGFGFVVGGKDQPNKLWVEDLHHSSFGATIVATGTWHFRPLSRPGMRGPMTFVYVPVEDGYRLAHLNFGTYR